SGALSAHVGQTGEGIGLCPIESVGGLVEENAHPLVAGVGPVVACADVIDVVPADESERLPGMHGDRVIRRSEERADFFPGLADLQLGVSGNDRLLALGWGDISVRDTIDGLWTGSGGASS